MKKKAKQARSAVTIQAILDAASQVLISEGYARASTNRIAERAGFSVGTLYQYFDDKEDVYREMIERSAAELLKVIADQPEQDTLRDQLEALNAQLFVIFSNDEGLIQSVGRLLAASFQELQFLWRERLIEAFAVLIEPHRSEISCTDLLVAASVVICASEGLSAAIGSKHFVPDTALHHLLRLQMAYLTTDID